MANTINNEVVWITGASDGIGEALVHEFANAGYAIVLSARREDKLRAVAQSANLTDDKYLILPFDLSQLPDSEILVGKIKDKFGRLDILLLNAGLALNFEFLVN